MGEVDDRAAAREVPMRTRAPRHRRSRTRRTPRALAGVAALSALLTATPALLEAPATATTPATPATGTAKDRTASPLVIGHRGASGYRPEHTLASYSLAIDLGADYIEPDLVSTKDGVLVARHENEIGTTTDVGSRPEFAARKTTKSVDGASLTGWFTEDFTLTELRTLRAVERIPQVRQENTLCDGRYQVPTFEEVLALARRATKARGRTIGVYAETKHPTYFDGIGLSLEEPLVRSLQRYGYRDRNDPVFIQSFEVGNLRELSRMTRVRITQLFGGNAPGGPAQPWDAVVSGSSLTYDAMSTPAGLRRIATYADGIGPDKNRVITRDPDGSLGATTRLVRDAHRRSLLVHPYTFRNENAFLPTDLRRGSDPTAYGNAFAEYAAFFAAGVDGVFADNPDTARLARDERLREAA